MWDDSAANNDFHLQSLLKGVNESTQGLLGSQGIDWVELKLGPKFTTIVIA
jgi:hypothetical protein